jgi:hypothetical protein
MLSGEEDALLEARALAQGARAFLSKSTAPALLLRTLLQMLAQAVPPGSRLPAPRASGPWLPMPVSRN